MEKLYEVDRDQRVSSYFYKFDDVADIERLQSYDRYAAKDIERAEELIKALMQYRIDLYEHYQKIAETKSHQELHFTREPNYKAGRVDYFVKIIRLYADAKIKQQTEFSQKFTGAERHKARAFFEQIKKERPGIKTHVDLEKKKWEK